VDGIAERDSSGFHAQGIRKAFGKHVVLDGLDLDVPIGCTLGLLGSNGSGKTTLLKILLGLLPLDTGASCIAGEPSNSLSPRLRERIGYVPQTSASFTWLSGKAMLDYIAAFYPTFDREYAENLTERWKVSLKTPIEALSPGQQQRLSIVRALAPRPNLLVLDEPISSLDPPTRIAVIEELLAEQARRPLTVIFSSHITSDLMRLCSHFSVLAGGKIAVTMRSGDIDANDFDKAVSQWMR
jgi:ABC-2 type transport system ATP-binding protein